MHFEHPIQTWLVFTSRDREGFSTTIDFNPHGYVNVPGCWSNTYVARSDCIAELVVDHSVLVSVSIKLLKGKRRLCFEMALRLCAGSALG